MVEKVKQDIRFKILKITSKDIMENDVNMLGKPYYIKPRNLVYLFLDIQQDYGIKIAEEYLKISNLQQLMVLRQL